jgi:Zn-dependent protease with chaperone function
LLEAGVARSILPVLLLLAIGCGLPAPVRVDRADVGRDNPMAEASRRLDSLGRSLAQGIPALEETTFRVSARDDLGAWAWRGGSVEVSRSLMGLLDDAELSAALAHELGHLLGRSSEGAALAGGANDDGIERAADRRGCWLLSREGIRPESMASMLAKLAARLPEASAPLEQRIQTLDTACRSDGSPRL